MKEKRHIAQFIGSLDSGGAESLVINLSRYLIEHHYEVTVICRRGSWVSGKCLYENIPYITLSDDLEMWWKPIYGLPFYTHHFRQFLSDLDIDLLHSHLYKAAIENFRACYLLTIPHVATMHDSYTCLEKPSRRKWLGLARLFETEFVSVSNSVRKDCGLPNNTYVIPNGVMTNEVPTYRRTVIRNELGIRNNEFLVITVARLIPLKRIDYLIDAIVKIISTHTGVMFHLVIVGDGPEYDALKRRVPSDLETFIHFTGFRDDVPDLLSASDLFVLPSSTEGLSYSIIEAMMAGLPIVATDVGGNKMLVNWENGRLIPVSDDVGVLASAITAIAELPPPVRYELGKNSLRYARERYSIESTGDSYARLYEDLL